MDFDSIAARLESLPFTERRLDRAVFDFVRRHGVVGVLELGFAHGVSTCYLAAGVVEHGGSVVAIDSSSAYHKVPSIHDLLDRTGLAAVVAPIFAHHSCTSELMHIIESRSRQGVCRPMFDFCLIHGGKTWEDTGLAFFLVEKLLVPGGTLLFEDAQWTSAGTVSPALTDSEWTTPRARRVFDLLVHQHPAFECVRAEGPWNWARKRLDGGEVPAEDGGSPLDGRDLHASSGASHTVR